MPLHLHGHPLLLLHLKGKVPLPLIFALLNEAEVPVNARRKALRRLLLVKGLHVGVAHVPTAAFDPDESGIAFGGGGGGGGGREAGLREKFGQGTRVKISDSAPSA